MFKVFSKISKINGVHAGLRDHPNKNKPTGYVRSALHEMSMSFATR